MKEQVRIAVVLCVVTMAFSLNAVAQRSIHGASPIEATLVIPDGKLLPGVPFEMWIDVRNPTDSPVGVGLCSSLLVHPEQGQLFEVSGKLLGHFPKLLEDSNSMPMA